MEELFYAGGESLVVVQQIRCVPLDEYSGDVVKALLLVSLYG